MFLLKLSMLHTVWKSAIFLGKGMRVELAL